jgi:hypothetical protein
LKVGVQIKFAEFHVVQSYRVSGKVGRR